MKNVTLCILMHLFGKSTVLCKCPLNGDSSENDQPPLNVNINYINQRGKANIAGDGTIEYQSMREKVSMLERLQAENKMLSDMVQLLQNRDKSIAKNGL